MVFGLLGLPVLIVAAVSAIAIGIVFGAVARRRRRKDETRAVVEAMAVIDQSGVPSGERFDSIKAAFKNNNFNVVEIKGATLVLRYAKGPPYSHWMAVIEIFRFPIMSCLMLGALIGYRKSDRMTFTI